MKSKKFTRYKTLFISLCLIISFGVTFYSLGSGMQKRIQIKRVLGSHFGKIVDLNKVVDIDWKESEKNNLYLKLNNNTTTVYSFSEPVMYNDAGEFKCKELSIEKQKNDYFKKQGYLYSNGNNDYKINFSEDKNKGIKVCGENFEYSLVAKPNKKDMNNQILGKVIKENSKNDKVEAFEYNKMFGDKTSLKYYPQLNGIKDCIVLNEYTGQNEFEFVLNTKDCYAQIDKDGNLCLYNEDNKEKVQEFIAPFAYDKNGNQYTKDEHYTDDCIYKLSKIKDKKYKLTICVSDKFLKSKKTEYPVTIDPVTGKVGNCSDVPIASESNLFSSKDYNIVGFIPQMGVMRTLIKFNLPSGVKNGTHINSANYCTTEVNENIFKLDVTANLVNGSWSDDTNFESQPRFSNDPLCTIHIDGDSKDSGADLNWYKFNITSAVNAWTHGTTNNGFILKSTDESRTSAKMFVQLENPESSKRPYTVINYTNDDVLPTVSSVSGNPTEWTRNSVTLKINGARDSGSGLHSAPYSFSTKKGIYNWQSSNVSPAYNSNATIYVYVRDKAGNIRLCSTENINKIDNKGPTISKINGNPKNWTNKDVELSIEEANDNGGSGLNTEAFSFSKKENEYNWQKSNKAKFNKNSDVFVYVRDVLGNINLVNKVAINKLDKVKPIIKKYTKENNPDGTFKVSIDAIDEGGSKIKDYSFDEGETWQNENFKIFKNNKDGIKLKVRDNSLNEASYVNLPPSNLRLTGATNKTVRLEWSPSVDNSGISKYIIFKNNKVVGETRDCSYEVKDLDNKTSYNFFIKAVNSVGIISKASNTIKATTGMGIPCNVKADIGSNKVVVNWDKVYGATSYDVEIGDKTYNVNNNSITFEDLAKYTTYNIKVRANVNEFKGEWCKEIYFATSNVTEVGGELSKDLTFDSLHEYLVKSDLVIPQGKTLTIKKGAIIKVDEGKNIIVHGNLNAEGTSYCPVIFTSSSEKKYGGNGNYFWNKIKIEETGIANINNAILKYGGDSKDNQTNNYIIESNGTLHLNNSKFDNVNENGILLYNDKENNILNNILNVKNIGLTVSAKGKTKISNNEFNNCNLGIYFNECTGDVELDNNEINSSNKYSIKYNIEKFKPASLTGLDNNLFENGIVISAGKLNYNVFDKRNTYIIEGEVIIPKGKTLSLKQGSILKFKDEGMFNVKGTLNSVGTSSQPITFTSINDPMYGGLKKSYWKGIESSGQLNISNSIVRYAGIDNLSSAISSSGSTNICSCKIENSCGSGIDIQKNSPNREKFCIEKNIIKNIYEGIGIHVKGDCIIDIKENNIINSEFAGIYIFDCKDTFTINNNTISNNSGYSFYAVNFCSALLKDFESNEFCNKNKIDSWRVNQKVTLPNKYFELENIEIEPNGILNIEKGSRIDFVGFFGIDNEGIVNIKEGSVIELNCSNFKNKGIFNIKGTEKDKVTISSSSNPALGGDGNGYGGSIDSGDVDKDIGELNIEHANISYIPYIYVYSGKLNIQHTSFSNCKKAVTILDSNFDLNINYCSFTNLKNKVAICSCTNNENTLNDFSYNYWGSSNGPEIHSTKCMKDEVDKIYRKSDGYAINTGWFVGSLKFENGVFYQEFMNRCNFTRFAPYYSNDLNYQEHFGENGVYAPIGSFSRQYTDMKMSNALQSFEINRTYNSKDNRKNTAFGKGWSFGFESNIHDLSADIYDMNGKFVSTQTKPEIKVVRLPNGSVCNFTDEGNGIFTSNDSRNKLKKIKDKYVLTLKDQTVYEYNSKDRLSKIKDKNGNAITINYNDDGKFKSIVDCIGRTYKFYYDGKHIKAITNASTNKTVKYGYTNNNLTTVTDASGAVTHYSYDHNDCLVQVKNNNNVLIDGITYYNSTGDNKNKISSLTDRNGNTSVYKYDNANNKILIKDQNNHKKVQYYDENYNVIKEEDSEGKNTLITYPVNSKYGEPDTINDRTGATIHYVRDNNGNILSIKNPDGSQKVMTYDDKNNITSQKDENGKICYMFYDENCNLIKKVKPLNGTDVYKNDATDNDSLFAITKYSYYKNGEGASLSGLIKNSIDPNGNLITYTYDSFGNVSSKKIGNKTTNYEFSSDGLLIKKTSPKGNNICYSYDNNGRQIKKILDENKVYRTVYNSNGNVIKQISPNEYDPNSEGDNFSYSADHGTRFKYYSTGKVKEKKDALGNLTLYTYDIYGNVLTETLSNGSIYEYEYDVMNRPIKKYFRKDSNSSQKLLETYSYSILENHNTQTVKNTYINQTNFDTTTSVSDYAGRELSRQDADGLSTYASYNPNGTVKTSTDKNGQVTYYQYNGLNKVTGQWVPFSLNLYIYTGYEYDNAGRVTKEKVGVNPVANNVVPSNCLLKSFTYNADGTVDTETKLNGGKIEYSYDKDGNVTTKQEYLSKNKSNITKYEYNYLGKVSKETVKVPKGEITGNSYSDNELLDLTTAYTYDKNGNVKICVESNGLVTNYTYDNMNNVLSVSQLGKDENGKDTLIKVSKTYNNIGKVATETDTLGNTVQYEYDKRGNLVKEINPLGDTNAYYYDLKNRLTSAVSNNDYKKDTQLSEMNRTEFTYDSMGRAITQTQVYYDTATEEWKSFVEKANKYDANGNVIKELDALGYEAGTGSTVQEKINSGYGIEKSYNYANQLISEISPQDKENGLTFTNKYSYDGLGRDISKESSDGSVLVNNYDKIGNIISVSFKDTKDSQSKVLKKCTYDYIGNKLTETDANGNTTTNEYNALGKLKSTSFAGDSSISALTTYYQYDKVGNLTDNWDTTGKKIKCLYDRQNNLLSESVGDIDGNQSIKTTYSYDKNGNVLSTTDGNGVKTEFKYDALGQKLSETRSEKKTSYTYDKNGNVLTTTDWLGNVNTNHYDALNRLVKKTDPFGNTNELNNYDNNHRQVTSMDALDNLTVFTYDKDGQLVMTTDPAGNENINTYDNVGNVIGETDGIGNETKYSYDKQHRLLSVTAPNQEVTSYTYDNNGNMLTQTDASGKTTTYEYNVANKVTKIIDPNGRTEENGTYKYVPGKVQYFTYTPDCQVKTNTMRNGTVLAYNYDIYGRMSKESATNGKRTQTVDYTYDNNNNLLTISDASGTTTRTYDDFGRVLTKSVPNIGTIDYEYDVTDKMETGEIAEKSMYPGGSEVTKVYDQVGRLSKVIADESTTQYNYYDNGNVSNVVYGDGSKEEYEYTRNGLLSTLVNKKADDSIIDSYTYQYDKSNNITSKTDNTGTTSYTYDSLNRLLTETYPSEKTIAYTYDGSGNRLTQTETENSVESVTTYTYDDQNKLITTDNKENGIAVDKTDYTYDDNGNMLEKRVTPYENGQAQEQILKLSNIYDCFNQLTMSVTDDGKTICNTYNGEGLRIQKAVDGVATNYLYEGQKVVGEYDGKYKLKAQNIQGLNLLIRKQDDNTYYYMYNGHADVVGLLNAKTGNIDASYYYDAFGNILNKTGNVNNSFLYAGYQYDEETGLYYLNARMYDSETARFVQEDTYRGNPNDPLSLNLYAYCANNPIMYVDPTGHNVELVTRYVSSAAFAELLTGAAFAGEVGLAIAAGTVVIGGVCYICDSLSTTTSSSTHSYPHVGDVSISTPDLSGIGDISIPDIKIDIPDINIDIPDINIDIPHISVPDFNIDLSDWHMPDMSDLGDLSLPELSDWSMPDLSDWSIDFSDISIPDFSDISIPDLSNLSIPDFSDISIPDLSNLSIPDFSDISIPDLSSLHLPICDTNPLPKLGLETLPLTQEIGSIVLQEPSLLLGKETGIIKDPLPDIMPPQLFTFPGTAMNLPTITTFPSGIMSTPNIMRDITWNKGSFDSIQHSLEYHFGRHGAEVGAKSIEQYLRKAESFKENKRGAKKHAVDGAVEGVTRYVKNGKYIDLAPDGTVVSFGRR